MGHAILSTAELAGWRRYWDGWVICPACMAKRGHTPETWRVPPTYDDAIKPPYRCAECREEAPSDSGRHAERENPERSGGVEAEGCQSGGGEAGASPKISRHKGTEE